jgi:hypothetical protein
MLRSQAVSALRPLLPAGSTLTTVPVYSRRSVKGATWTGLQVRTPTGQDISALVATATGNRYCDTRSAPRCVRGQWGGMSPGRALTDEVSIALHGSSTALANHTPAPSDAAYLAPVSHIGSAPSALSASRRARS